MTLDDSLDFVAETLSYSPYCILHEIMETAPLQHDLNSGKMSSILDGDALIMDTNEARMAIDFLQDFRMGWASDGNGHSVLVPLTVYEHKPTFRERHPYLHRGLCFGAIALTLGLVVAVSGCTSNGNGEITSKEYDNGKDGIRGTSDDSIIFTMQDHSGKYRIGASADENISHLDKIMEVGGHIDFDYDSSTGGSDVNDCYKVISVDNIKSKAEWQPTADAQNYALSWLGIGVGTFLSSLCLYFGIRRLINRRKEENQLASAFICKARKT